ncbi:MAG TPA: sigma-54 dependent transcriptional regulator [Thermodesulfovibrionia bacterium]|nr:sigma-54 dependent transcriptional regulator [Thermodesulfovibrionia bacterium]
MDSSILIIDDEKNIRDVLDILLQGEGYKVTLADGGIEGVEILKKDIFDLIITDIKMPHVDGFQVLKTTKELSPDTDVVLITAYGTTESAIEAMKLGAYDYIQKPFKMDEIRLVVKKALERRRLKEEVTLLKKHFEEAGSPDNIIGKSSKMKDLLAAVPKIAASDANVLILGESGSGKELVAKAIYQLSNRRKKSFVAINCAAIPEGLLESELFGYMKGSFTGAVNNKQGLFEQADSGTMFLDEIGDMPLTLQAKLLRVLEDGSFRRIGGLSDINVDVRIIAATNKDLLKAISERVFREDLYYRLNVLPVKIPPLRERKDDIPLLVDHFLRKNRKACKLTPLAMELVMNYQWKGNVRELENIVERLTILCDEELIDVSHLPDELRRSNYNSPETVLITQGQVNLDEIIENIEKTYLMRALEQAGGMKTEAARLLNINFRSFRHRLKKYGLGSMNNTFKNS